ncbi:MAG: GTPase HflX [Bdellovibrionales bacterium]|nr:GTPase HflX [Bdellovibrionales bacterium]
MQDKSNTKNAVLVGIQLPNLSVQDLDGSMRELKGLVTTLGYQVIGQVTQKRKSDRSASILGKGKLKELALWTGGSGEITMMAERKLSKAAVKWEEDYSEDYAEEDAEKENDEKVEGELVLISEQEMGTAQIVVVDTDLSPSQLRNLESAVGVPVLDRTGVIIEIFSRHARTRAARLQVEIAKLTYVAPRLRKTGGGEDRLGGGVGGKGAGESKLELDKRKIRDRIKELKSELASIGNEHQVRQARRGKELTVAIVGYTNAGKSSLMRAMTGSEVLIADKLFATLDTTIRPLYPESRPKILLSDTVGFIKKLPHDLVASFKSTLDEALSASLLLFVVDAADNSFRSQLEVTRKVLAEVGVGDTPSLLVLNKRDRISVAQAAELSKEFPDAVLISTRNQEDLLKLRNRVIAFFETNMSDEDIFVPYTVAGVVGEIRGKMRVLSESYDEAGVTLKVRGTSEDFSRLRKMVTKL